MNFYIYDKKKYQHIYRYLLLAVCAGLLFIMIYKLLNMQNQVNIQQNEFVQLEQKYQELNHIPLQENQKMGIDLTEIERMMFYPNNHILFKQIDYKEQTQQFFIHGFAQSIEDIDQLKSDLNQKESFKNINVISAAIDRNRKTFNIEFRLQGQL